MSHLLRSVLYVPGLNAKAMQKTTTLPVDAVVFDLEDSVLESSKELARATLRTFLTSREDNAPGLSVIRVNPIASDFWQADMALVGELRPDAVLLPKVDSATTIREANRVLNADAGQRPVKIWIMVENPLGILKLSEIVEQSVDHNLACLVLGTNDLVKDTDIDPGENRQNFSAWFAHIVLVGKSYGIPIIDGVLNDFHDTQSLERESRAAKALGMSGKTLIHPNQIETVNAAFSPTPEQLAWWRKIVEAYDMPENIDKGVIKVDGAMVERLHLEIAQSKLALFGDTDVQSPRTTP